VYCNATSYSIADVLLDAFKTPLGFLPMIVEPVQTIMATVAHLLILMSQPEEF